MQTLSAKDAKYGFGRLIDLARCVSPICGGERLKALESASAGEKGESAGKTDSE